MQKISVEPVCCTQSMEQNFTGFMGKCGRDVVWASFPSIRKIRAAKLYSWDDSQLQPCYTPLKAAQDSIHGHLSLQLWALPLQEKQAERLETSWREPMLGKHVLHSITEKAKLGGRGPEHSLCRLNCVRWEGGVQASLNCSL